jgi:hypothetical protein
LGLLEENVEFDDNRLVAFINKFETPLPPCSILMFGSLVKNMENANPEGEKVGAKKKRIGIT